MWRVAWSCQAHLARRRRDPIRQSNWRIYTPIGDALGGLLRHHSGNRPVRDLATVRPSGELTPCPAPPTNHFQFARKPLKIRGFLSVNRSQALSKWGQYRTTSIRRYIETLVPEYPHSLLRTNATTDVTVYVGTLASPYLSTPE
jgi:hypothetical protein